MKINLQNLKHELGADTISRKGGVITVRYGFFYTHGRDAQHYVCAVRKACPNANIVGSGKVCKAFRGGDQPVAQCSHFFVKFELPEVQS